jgi:hypothetical protein
MAIIAYTRAPFTPSMLAINRRIEGPFAARAN